MIINEDCLKGMKGISKVDYVFTVPPDFQELELTPLVNNLEYYNFLEEVIDGLIRISNVITIAITDRKYKSTIIPKHNKILRTFQLKNYDLISHKIWRKSDKINLYRINYTHIMTFAKKKPKQNHPRDYEYDVYTDKEEKYGGYPYGIALGVVEKLIRNFTQEGDVVYDPFMGSGTTAVACYNTKRKYIGNEINKDYYHLSVERIRGEKNGDM